MIEPFFRCFLALSVHGFGMTKILALLFILVGFPCLGNQLPFNTVFKGQDKFKAIVARVKPQAPALRALPIGERTVWFGKLLVGTPYKSYTLEIDDRVEAVSVNLLGLDCWTFFETALAFARMCELPTEQWTHQTLLKYLELDRYWSGRCDGTYLSRLHYLEDWARDNERRGLVSDLTRKLGGIHVRNAAVEMTNNWKGYRYMVNSSSNRAGISKLETRLRSQPLPMIPKSKVSSIESKIQSGDIVSIVSKDGAAFGTSHVGLAVRVNGVLRFMHASSPRNHGQVVIDSRLSDYLYRYKSHAGIMVTRPLR